MTQNLESRAGESQSQEIVNYKGHTESVTAVYINKFANRLFSCSLDSLCIIWDLFTGTQIKLINLSSPVISMAVEPMESICYLACKNKNVY